MSLFRHKSTTSLFVIGLAAVYLGGCDKIGQTPSGGDADQVKAALDSMPVEDRVKIEMHSPASSEVKLEHIKGFYAKAGKPVPDDILKQLGGAGTAH